ncbi:hypothetical protein [Atlantibacter hermannii]|uniref:hypothetical protein n=1 Tax=Atlantibacter hermannii TaxID=565 RepID=UPI0028B037F9|nr:hypothetical protein [Atlantibacter hermannii]
MTINERVSDERLSTLANLQSPECMALPAGHNEFAMMARELQQYRAAAEPVAFRWRWKDDGMNKPGEWIYHDMMHFEAINRQPTRECQLVYAAPQVTSVPDDAFERALSVLNDTLDDCGDSERGLLLALDRMGIEVAGAAPAEQAEQLSGNTEQVSQPVLPATQFKPVADLYGIAVPGGRSTSYSTDAAEASDCRVMGWDVQEFVKLERLQEAITGNYPAIPDGYALVPVEPTKEMMLHKSGCQRHAWDDADCPMRQTRRLVWSRMIEAVPKQEAQEVKK